MDGNGAIMGFRERLMVIRRVYVGLVVVLDD